MRGEAMALVFEFTTKIGEVVNLAVIGDEDRPIAIGHGHAAVGRKIENRKPAASEADVGAIGGAMLPQPGIVGTSMRLDVGHAGESFPVSAIHQTADATHP